MALLGVDYGSARNTCLCPCLRRHWRIYVYNSSQGQSEHPSRESVEQTMPLQRCEPGEHPDARHSFDKVTVVLVAQIPGPHIDLMALVAVMWVNSMPTDDWMEDSLEHWVREILLMAMTGNRVGLGMNGTVVDDSDILHPLLLHNTLACMNESAVAVVAVLLVAVDGHSTGDRQPFQVVIHSLVTANVEDIDPSQEQYCCCRGEQDDDHGPAYHHRSGHARMTKTVVVLLGERDIQHQVLLQLQLLYRPQHLQTRPWGGHDALVELSLDLLRQKHDGGASGRKIDTCLYRIHVQCQRDHSRDAGLDCSGTRRWDTRDGAHRIGRSYNGDVQQARRRDRRQAEGSRIQARRVYDSEERRGRREQKPEGRDRGRRQRSTGAAVEA